MIADPLVPTARGDGDETDRYAQAAEYRTQVQPLSDDPADAAILPPEVLERLLRDTETVFW